VLRRRKTMWEIAWARVGTIELLNYLKEGWEPFAALPDPVALESNTDPERVIIWLKMWHRA